MELKDTSVEFKVAMDNEQAKAKNHHVVKATVTFEGADPKTLVEMAIKAQVVAWQAQIRSHWDEFISGGLPSTLTFGEALYESGRGKVSVAKATTTIKDQMANMTQEEKIEFLKAAGLL